MATHSPLTEKTDEELVFASADGDDGAFHTLMNRYLARIFNFVRQYVRTPEDAEDVTQETFFKAWKHLKRFKSGSSWKPWIYTIARNCALDQIKKKKLTPFSELDLTEQDITFAETLEGSEPSPDEVFAAIESTEALTAALETIHPDHRSVIILHYHEEMTFEEIALTLDKPMNTVKSWHQRALLRLRQQMHQYRP